MPRVWFFIIIIIINDKYLSNFFYIYQWWIFFMYFLIYHRWVHIDGWSQQTIILFQTIIGGGRTLLLVCALLNYSYWYFDLTFCNRLRFLRHALCWGDYSVYIYIYIPFLPLKKNYHWWELIFLLLINIICECTCSLIISWYLSLILY
jgi:hypothetical protein